MRLISISGKFEEDRGGSPNRLPVAPSLCRGARRQSRRGYNLHRADPPSHSAVFIQREAEIPRVQPFRL